MLFKQPASLRKRYFSLTLLLGFTVMAIVMYFFLSTIATKDRVTSDRLVLQQQQSLIDTISENRFDVFRNLELFLLDPTIGYYDKIVYQKIDESIKLNDKLLSLIPASDPELIEASNSLKQLLENLESTISELFSSRLNVNKQFPGLALGTAGMTEPQQTVSNKFQILVEEIESGDLQPESDALTLLLLKSHTLWEKQISQYRIYLANRFASFSSDFLRVQANSLEELHLRFMRNIDTLASLYTTEDSFEGESSIETIREMASQWYHVFLDIRKINESDKWRTDNMILEDSVLPLIDTLSNHLQTIDGILLEQKKIIDSQIEENNNTLFTILVSIIVLFLLFITAILISLDRMVFHPIDLVSRALKSKAFNQKAPLIKTGKTREISALVEAFQEMDEKINQRQNELEHQALHDYLTALPNRFMLNQRLEFLLLTSERSQRGFSLFFMDLNNFKDVNDTLGHTIGDKLLLQVAHRLSSSVRKSDTVARLGGDEFAILLPEVNKKESERIATSLQESMNKPFIIEDKTIPVGMSIGIVQYPEDGTDATTLLQHADSAMYLAKRNRNTFAHYDKTVDFYSQNRLVLSQDLRKAIENDELMLFFQPQLQCKDEILYGAEALLRWNHREFGFIQPEKIIDLAEYNGIIHLLTGWVINQAIQTCANWHHQNYPINMSVNLSVQDLSNPQLHEQIHSYLQQHKLNARYLTLEITESGMMENPERSIDMLNKLKTMGIKLSVDDFGTGFSSLKYLKQLPVDELKIDKSFVLDMEKDENDKMIVQSTIQLGHNLGLEVVAEGVEHQGLLDMIQRFGCDRSQGYLFEKPMDKDDFLNYLKKHKSLS